MSTQSRVKDLHKLLRNVASFSDRQASIENYDEMTKFDVVIVPNAGLYRKGKFSFTVTLQDDYPDSPPAVHCNTDIYHPNIDTSGDICLNLLSDEWESTLSLEDVVQGLLFLIYNPNLDDPLNEYFNDGIEYDEFRLNVELSLQGGDVDGALYERNQVDEEEESTVNAAGDCKDAEVPCGDEPEVRNDEHTDGHTNGDTDGETTNGQTNGDADGDTDGHTNGDTDRETNGHTNGHTNGCTDGDTKETSESHDAKETVLCEDAVCGAVSRNELRHECMTQLMKQGMWQRLKETLTHIVNKLR
ncbi:ubiquitin-conjugating enzyme E2 S-like [Corticium candelabrum]|uniref:ubiquitin-conjugating enzyme E2 S-like n=1 Tax=Corticium candelabrum TaxID=121492 RepID=UPI002E25BF6F|nr:ubiquitin-conjugating enzyme E2 S-like [Corticium candelabrum]